MSELFFRLCCIHQFWHRTHRQIKWVIRDKICLMLLLVSAAHTRKYDLIALVCTTEDNIGKTKIIFSNSTFCRIQPPIQRPTCTHRSKYESEAVLTSPFPLHLASAHRASSTNFILCRRRRRRCVHFRCRCPTSLPISIPFRLSCHDISSLQNRQTLLVFKASRSRFSLLHILLIFCIFVLALLLLMLFCVTRAHA